MNQTETAKMYIPKLDPRFVPNGNHDDLKRILASGSFLPVLLTGPTGAGKTKMVEQIHNEIQKPLVRVNITIESDEDSLMGGFRLKDGSTYFDKGPVVRAMEMGATLLFDELDLGNPMKIMCLQSVLEKGGGYLIKKTGEYISPSDGFAIVATANTKGLGDEDGIYVGTQTLNGAMLDRFPIIFDCEYATKSVETNILKKVLEDLNFQMPDEEIQLLVDWAEAIRKGGGASSELEYSISTRRLVNVVEINQIYRNLETAVKMSLNRFDGHHKQAFMEVYKSLKPSKGKIDPDNDPFAKADVYRF